MLLKQYGKDWKLISKHLESRTAIQVRTHGKKISYAYLINFVVYAYLIKYYMYLLVHILYTVYCIADKVLSLHNIHNTPASNNTSQPAKSTRNRSSTHDVHL